MKHINVIINIRTNNKVINSNAESINGNVHTWEINSLNSNNVNIEFEVSKGFPWKNVILYASIVIGVVLLISCFIYFIYNKNKKNNSIN